MKTIISLLFVGLSLSLFSQNELKVNSNFPSKIEQGKTYDIKIVIEKPEIRSYAVYKQKFPEGLKITSVNSDEADFSFENNILTCQWYRLSKKDKITIDYTVKVESLKTGKYFLTGNMVYVYNNNQGYIDLPVKSFEVVEMSIPPFDENKKNEIKN